MAYTAIDDPEAYFQAKLYTGDGASTLAITGVGFQPDFTWIKCRTISHNHTVYDSVRTATKVLESNLNNAEATRANSLKSFDTDGFTLGDWDNVNDASDPFVGWNWKESATAGFDIVAYTGNGTDDTDISHSLSAVPHVMIVKNRTSAHGWNVYHHKNTSAPETDYLSLDENGGTNDSANSWSDEAPTSSVFTLGGGNGTNKNTDSLIAYLWSEKQGFSKFGKHSGNGNADGVFVYTGFKPAMIICKRYDSTGSWTIHDNKRNAYNGLGATLYPHLNNGEDSGEARSMDFLSNGFKFRGTDEGNVSGEDYITIAFAEAPFVNSNGVPCNAR